MNKIADKIIRVLPYTMVAGGVCGSVLCGYRDDFDNSITSVPAGVIVGCIWPVVVPIGVFAWGGYQIRNLTQKIVKDKD